MEPAEHRIERSYGRRFETMDGADADLSDEGSRELAQRTRGLGPAMGRQCGWAGHFLQPEAARHGCFGFDVGLVTREAHPRRGPIPQHGQGPIQNIADSKGVSRTGEPALHGGQWPCAQDDFTDQAERSVGTHEQPAEVEAGHILYRWATGGDNEPIGGDVACL